MMIHILNLHLSDQKEKKYLCFIFPQKLDNRIDLCRLLKRVNGCVYRLITKSGFNNTLLTSRVMMCDIKLCFHSLFISPSKINEKKGTDHYFSNDRCVGFFFGGGGKGKNNLGVDFPLRPPPPKKKKKRKRKRKKSLLLHRKCSNFTKLVKVQNL